MLNVLLLGVVSLFADLQSEIIFPLLPLFITQELGLSALGLLHMASGLAILPGSIVAGLIWDRWQGAGTFAFGAACAALAAVGILYYDFTRTRRIPGRKLRDA